jgi:probable O-glycosylation ligase (exosortase A-associated)
MGLRDVVVLGIVFGCLPAAFRRPYVGLLLFSWLGYMRVQDLAWSIGHWRLSFLVAAALFGGFFLFEWGKRRLWLPDPRCRLMLLLLGIVGLSALLVAGMDAFIFGQYVQFAKILAVALITTSLVDSRERMRGLLLVIGLSLGFFGLKGGLFVVLRGGEILRGPGGFIQDNNDFSLALVMAIPLLVYGALGEKDRRLKWLMWGTAAGCVGTIALTHSRGGFLALAAAGAVMVWNSRQRMLGIAFGLVACLVLLFSLPQSVWDRLSTIKEYQLDSSAMARLKAWGIAFRMIKDQPILGVGFWNFQVAYPRYDPATALLGIQEGRSIVAHNSYLQIWAECGTLAILTYLLLFVVSFLDLRRLRRYSDAGLLPPWVGPTARAFEASLAGFMVGAVFLNRAHFDLAYHLVGAAVALSAVARAEGAAQGARAPAPRFPAAEVRAAPVRPVFGAAPSRPRGSPTW